METPVVMPVTAPVSVPVVVQSDGMNGSHPADKSSRTTNANEDPTVTGADPPAPNNSGVEDGFTMLPSKICRYFKSGKCRRGASCKYLHPSYCPTFLKKGLKKFSAGGCDETCGLIHPTKQMCKKALKTGKCDRAHCTYKHPHNTKNALEPECWSGEKKLEPNEYKTDGY